MSAISFARRKFTRRQVEMFSGPAAGLCGDQITFCGRGEGPVY
jgi:hypothetical protein